MSEFSEEALAILSERYLKRAGDNLESPSAMLDRVAEAISLPARIFGEDAAFWHDRFAARLHALEFLPNSSTLMNAGPPAGQLAACFVLPVADDLDSIFAALSLAARIHQTGGGTGFSFSNLRPRGNGVSSTGGVSSGPLSFMELFDHSTAVMRCLDTGEPFTLVSPRTHAEIRTVKARDLFELAVDCAWETGDPGL